MIKFWKLISTALLYLAPIHPLMLLLGLGAIIDTIMGRWAAKKIAQKEGKDVRLEVTSRKTRIGLVSKLITYQLVIISLFVLDGYLLNDLVTYFLPSFPITYAVTKLIGVILLLIEFDSIDEHIYKVKGIRFSKLIKNQIKRIKNIIMGLKNFKDKIKGDND